ncbi:DUF1176 domain-containing protein [Chromobacterium sp.]|uniref:DUF1176 domain-containing protein n=1 Tax=Chromobacterium sp. TaxID=306190 RepID=UPI0035AFBEFA
MRIHIMVAALAALGLPAASWAKAQVYKDWAVACDNTRHCEANGTQGDEGGNPVSLLLKRDGGPNAPLSGELLANSEEGGIGPLSLRVGGFSLQGLKDEQTLSAAQMAKLLPRMLDADAAELSDGKQQWRLSLAGLKAALLRMDEAQGRLGTPGALVKKGTKPEASVPPALPAPLLRPVPTAARPGDDALAAPILKAVRERDCWEQMPDEEHPAVSVHRLSAKQVLVLRECGRGAYQSGSSVWIAQDKPPYQSRLAQLPGGEPEYQMNAEFDQGVLSSFSKGRGFNDCNASSAWAWTGSRFELMHDAEAPQCSGIPGGISLRSWVTRQQ